jgi:hypothetical protein
MAMPKSGGPDVVFRVNFPKDGLYKVWGEFMHKGKIITAPFVVEVGMGDGNSGDSGAGAGGAEHGTHSH